MDVIFVGTYVPRRCGIATFTHDLSAAVAAADRSVTARIMAIDEPASARPYGPEVITRIRQGDVESYRAAARVANASDVVNIQHEFGLYGARRNGVWEDHLVAFLEELRVPAMTWLHTVLPRPQRWMRDAVQDICHRSERVVVMTHTAATLLREVYSVEREPLVIPHGVPVVSPVHRAAVKSALGFASRTLISTFGLVDPRKGIEDVIGAMPEVVAADPTALYLVIGQTHPEVRKHAGESYRDGLVDLVRRLGLEQHVSFVDRYLNIRQLVEYLQATDVYVTPYRDPDQITSGTLAYALGSGKAIVSTRYQHAAEVLGNGRGLLVDFERPDQIAEALVRLLRDPAERERLESRAYEFGRTTTWPIVGRRTYDEMLAMLPTVTRCRVVPPKPPSPPASPEATVRLGA